MRYYLAIIFALFFISCSPEYKLARLKRKNPHLFLTKYDTITKIRTVIDSFTINLPSDTIAFDTILREYVRFKTDTVYTLNTEEIYKRDAYIKSLERRLRQGVFKPFSQHFEIDSVSFDIIFNPALGKMYMINLKVPEKTYKETTTAVVEKPLMERIVMWALIIIAGLTILSLFLPRRKN